MSKCKNLLFCFLLLLLLLSSSSYSIYPNRPAAYKALRILSLVFYQQWSTVVAVLLATLVSLSRGYQNGAPTEACVSMFPRHQAEAQTSPSPYNIILNTATYTPGSNNTVAGNNRDAHSI